CGHPVRGRNAVACRACRRKMQQDTAKEPCPRCGRPGYLREDTGWCGICSRPRQDKDPPRPCAECGQVRRHEALGLCSACWQGRSMGPLARSLETFFTEHGLALPTDHAEQLAAGRRQSRVDAVPGPLRPAVAGFAGSMLAARQRARRAGTRPRTDKTIETALT